MRRNTVSIATCVAAAFLVRVLVWFVFPNQIWPDEIFQTLEQAHRVVFGFGVVPWEFREGTRSWLMPGTLAGIMAAVSVVSTSPVAYLGACATFLSAIAVAPIWAATRAAFVTFGTRGAIVVGVALASWFELVYFAPKALNEVVSGNCLLLGVLYADAGTTRRAVIATIFLTLAALLRIQVAPAAFACWLWMMWRTPHDRWRLTAVGAGLVVAAGLLDWITWSYPFQSFVENVRMNVVEGKSRQFGVAPWYEYFLIFARVWGLWGVVVMALAVIGARARPLLAVAAVVVVATHLPIAHKEYRFMYPALLLVMTLAAFGSARVVQLVEMRRYGRLATIGIVAAWLAATLHGAAGFTEAATRGDVRDPEWHFTQARGGLLAFAELRTDANVCGIAIVGFDPFLTGGYTWLHRDIPLYVALHNSDLPDLARRANVFLVSTSVVRDRQIGELALDHCISNVCLFRRSGSCTTDPGYSFNQMLEAYGH